MERYRYGKKRPVIQQLEKMEQQLRDIRRNIAEIELDNDIY